jgi:hypothetical protein
MQRRLWRPSAPRRPPNHRHAESPGLLLGALASSNAATITPLHCAVFTRSARPRHCRECTHSLVLRRLVTEQLVDHCDVHGTWFGNPPSK